MAITPRSSFDFSSANMYDEFHLFPYLPPELRIKIWQFSLPGARIVEVHCGSDSISDKATSSRGSSPGSLHGSNSGSSSCQSPARLPVALSVCRESRAEALRRYRCLFGFAGRPGRVYFNPSCDVLYFGPCESSGLMGAHAQFRTLVALCEPEDLMQVRRIAVDEAVLGHASPGIPLSEQHHMLMDAVRDLLKEHVSTRLPCLEEIVFISEHGWRMFDPSERLVQPALPNVNGNDGWWRTSFFEDAVRVAMGYMRYYRPHWRRPLWTVVSKEAFKKKELGGIID